MIFLRVDSAIYKLQFIFQCFKIKDVITFFKRTNGANCYTITADLSFYYYEAEFTQGLLTKHEKKLSRSFNFTFRYIDDVHSIINSMFGDYNDLISPIEFEIKDTLETAMSASNIDLQLEIERRLTVKFYDSRNYLNFPSVNFPFKCKKKIQQYWHIYLHQVRYFGACFSYSNFFDGWLLLTALLLNQEFLVIKLKSLLQMFYYRRLHVLISFYRISVKILTRKVK